MTFLLLVFATTTVSLAAFLLYQLYVAPRVNPLYRLAGPTTPTLFHTHLPKVLDPAISPKVHERLTELYGRSVRIRGVGPWDDRLLTMDPASVNHILKNSTVYEKPWQSRKLITSLIGCGMLSAEGQTHKRQRRVATPAFSIQNLRALVPLVFTKGTDLKDRWMDLIQGEGVTSLELDVCHWVSRATFDVIGLASFDYEFHAIHNEDNELFVAYKDMFEMAISQGGLAQTVIAIYFPFIHRIFPDKRIRTVHRCQKVIQRVAGDLIAEKKRKIAEGEKSGNDYNGRDLLTLLLKANVATDLPPEARISDQDVLHTINTFMFAGSDTSSLSLTWTLLLLAQNPLIQARLRAELVAVSDRLPNGTDISTLSEEEIRSLDETLSLLPFLHNVVRESLRLIPPVHSSIRVATKDDQLPTMYPVHNRDGTVKEGASSVSVAKGNFIHVAIEAFNLDKAVWGEDAWDFNPDRWEDLPDLAKQQPGLFSNLLTFSAGPRSCIGLRFSLIEIKAFLFILLTNFAFTEADCKIRRANVVLTRPFVMGQYKQGSRCPMIITPI